MGANLAKATKRNEKGKLVGNSESGNQMKQANRQIRADHRTTVDNAQSSGEVRLKRKTLKELQKECPPGFRKFELEVGLESIDEDIALQLWEDVFKPLYTFRVRSPECGDLRLSV
ncbi:hypothetical protein ACROYT_G028112 [Oculina patagonica]